MHSRNCSVVLSVEDNITGGDWGVMVHRTSVIRVAVVKENAETGEDRTEQNTYKNNQKKFKHTQQTDPNNMALPNRHITGKKNTSAEVIYLN